MSTALIGISIIQIYWIRFSIKLDEDKFDKNVFLALNDVADRLELEEKSKREAISYFTDKNPSFVARSFSSDILLLLLLLYNQVL